MWSPPVEGLAKGNAAAQKALELDPDLAEAHAALGNVLWIRDWDWSGAERELRKAIELNPGYVTGHRLYSELLAWTGRLEEATAEQQRAEELDPFWVSSVTQDLGRLYELRGEREKAMAEWERALGLAPNYYRTHQHLGNHYCQEGALEKAIASLERAQTLSPDDPHIVADLGYCYAISGKPAEARKLLRDLEEQSRRRYISPMTLALVHVGLAEHDAAFEWLEQAYEVKALMLTSIRMDTRYGMLSSDPRFDDLLRRIGFLESQPVSAL